MNYGELRTQFVSLLNRRDLTPSLRDTFINQGIARIQRTLRVPAMERAIEVTWGENTTALPIPDDLLELKTITCGPVVLEQRDIQSVLRASSRTGTAMAFARRGGAWTFAPTPQVGDKLRIDYYAEIPSLSEDTDTNWLSVIAPELILSAALIYACSWALDERKAEFMADFTTGLAELQAQAARDELSGAAVQAPGFYYPEACW